MSRSDSRAVNCLIVTVLVASLHAARGDGTHSPPGAPSNEPVYLFRASSSPLPKSATPQEPEPYTLRTGALSVADRIFEDGGIVEGPVYAIELFDDLVLEVVFTIVEQDAFGQLNLAGHFVDQPLSTIVLTRGGDMVIGTVVDVEEERAYSIRMVPGGRQVVVEHDLAAMPPKVLLPPLVPPAPN